MKQEIYDFFENPLDKLPFEILEIIFEYLENEDLKALLYIIGRTREIIIASPISMRKLKLNLSEDWIMKVPFVKDGNGKFVKNLIFEYINFDSADQFKNLITHMRNIETIKLSNVHINAENFNRNYKRHFIDFEKTHKLEFDNSQAVGKLVSLYLENIQVYEMKLDFCHYHISDVFVRLLCFQDYLKTLELSGIFENIFYQSLFSYDLSYMITFELKKLILNYRVTKNENFLKFVQCLSHLEHLEIYKEVEYQEFLNVIFEMKNLKSLTLATHFTTLKNIDFKKSMKSQIEELVLVTRAQYGIEQTINYLVEKLYNLKTLKVINLKTDGSDQIFGFVNFKVLENLSVENSKLKFFQNIKFECLKSVKLTSIHPFLKFEDWENFFKNNQNIQELIITDFEVYCIAENIKTEVDKIIKNLHFMKSLKYLEINQDLRYQKPMKVVLKLNDKYKIMRVSDSFIKICREEFHLLRKLYDNVHLEYYADDYFRLTNKYLCSN